MKKISLKKITLLSVFTALYVVAELYSPMVSNFRISLTPIVILTICILCGALDSLVVATLGSFIYQVILYSFGPTTLIWMIPGIVRVLICGKSLYKIDFKLQIKKFIFIVLLSSIAVTILNVAALYLDSIIYHYYTEALIFGDLIYKFILSIISSILYILVLPIIALPLRKARIINE